MGDNYCYNVVVGEVGESLESISISCDVIIVISDIFIPTSIPKRVGVEVDVH